MATVARDLPRPGDRFFQCLGGRVYSADMEKQQLIWQKQLRALNKRFDEQCTGASSVDILREIGHINIEIGRLNSLLRSGTMRGAEVQPAIAVVDDGIEDEDI
jgi:hypothetical protein